MRFPICVFVSTYICVCLFVDDPHVCVRLPICVFVCVVHTLSRHATSQEAKQRYRIDASQIYAVGHSNGGLMSQVMACQHSDLFNGMATDNK